MALEDVIWTVAPVVVLAGAVVYRTDVHRWVASVLG